MGAWVKWQPVKDIKLLQEKKEKAQILVLLKDPESEGNLLRYVSFLRFSVVHELVVSEGTTLNSLGEGAETKNIKLKA